MPSVVVDIRPQFNFKARPAPPGSPKVRPGDRCTWTNPNTQQEWPDVQVEFVYPQQGTVLGRGCFGGVSVRTGNFRVETRVIRIEDLRVTGHASDRQVL